LAEHKKLNADLLARFGLFNRYESRDITACVWVLPPKEVGEAS